MSDPTDKYPLLDPNRVYALPHAGADRHADDVVALLVGHACATLELVGKMTGREPEVGALVRTIRDEFGR